MAVVWLIDLFGDNQSTNTKPPPPPFTHPSRPSSPAIREEPKKSPLVKAG
jgi:hypothetical protein